MESGIDKHIIKIIGFQVFSTHKVRLLQSCGTIRVLKRCYLSAFGAKKVRNEADKKRAVFSKIVCFEL